METQTQRQSIYDSFTAPGNYAVFVTVKPNKRNGITREFTARVGAYQTETLARAAIVKDREAMCNTFGGLIDAPGNTGRSYRIFKSNGWTELA